MNSIKIGEFIFQAVNGGLLITIEGKEHRFDPNESMTLVEYLDKYRESFQSAQHPESAEPAMFSREWYDREVNKAFERMPD